MKRLFLLLIIALGSVLPGFAQSEDDNPLLDMLGFIPDTPEIRESQTLMNYVDFAANEQALNTDIFATYDLTGDLWVYSFDRVQWGGASYFLPQLEGMSDVVGFGWRDVNRLFEAGLPPDFLTVYEGEFDRDAIDAALSARDFATEERGGISVWHRFDDNATNLAETEPADPFSGHLGSGARIADYDGQLVFARNWPTLEGAIAARAGEAPSLAAADDFRALAEALNDGEGSLLRAMLLPEGTTQQFNSLPEAPSIILERLPEEWGISVEGWGSLPAPGIAAIADRQEGEDQVNIIALVYDDAATAESAAQEMTTRLQTFDPGLYEELGVTIDAPRVYEDESGFAVALASVRYPLILEADPETGDLPRPGQLILRWQNMIFRLDFFLMAAEFE
jgi:hypothetical protein